MELQGELEALRRGMIRGVPQELALESLAIAEQLLGERVDRVRGWLREMERSREKAARRAGAKALEEVMADSEPDFNPMDL